MKRQLSAGEISAMRGVLNDTMTSRASIFRNAPSGDQAGGQTGLWGAIAGDVPCFFYYRGQGGNTEEISVDRIEVNSGWTFLFPAGTDIRNEDRIQVDTRTFEVTSVDTPKTIDLDVTVGANEVT